MLPDFSLRETLPAIVRRSLADRREIAVVERVAGRWTPTSATRLLERVENLACAIRSAGLERGDRVALISANRVDWMVADFAILFAGCVAVPIYPTQAVDQVAFILADAQAKLLFIDTPAALQRLREGSVAVPRTVMFEGDESSLDAFESSGAVIRKAHPEQPGIFEATLAPDDLAVLIYTSGTTGTPKGVMLTHHNLGFTATSSFAYAFDVVTPGSPVLSVLPFSHIYEHDIMYGYLIARVQHFICRTPEELLVDLRDVRPVAVTAVPRIFERMLAGITGKALEGGGLRAKLVPWALATGRDYMLATLKGSGVKATLRLRYAAARALVLKKIRGRLGLDRLKFFVSGSAPLHIDTAMTLLACDLPIAEGYGPTECSPVITVNRLSDNRYGTVGRPIPGVSVKIAEDGEVLARGPNVMKGYYRDEAATASAISDGWYKTGDVGELDADGYLRITDRKRELFKTSGGKFIAPARVESAIKRSVFIAQAMVVGNARPHPAALVSPNWDMLRRELRLPEDQGAADLALRDDVGDFMTAEVRRQTADLASYEQIRRVVVLPAELTVEGGELSPTLKVKRRVVEARYADSIDRAYALELREAMPV